MTAGVLGRGAVGVAVVAAVLAATGCTARASRRVPNPADAINVQRANGDYGKAFPHVTGRFGQRPQLAPGLGSPVRNAASRILISGRGPVVTPGTAPVIRYLRAKWDGTVLHDSWAAGIAADPVPDDAVGAWMASDLGSVKVGSRVEVLVPSGESAQVFVVDIMQAGTP